MADEKVNFDEYSDRYQEHINDSIGASGESVAYFDEMKIDLISRWSIDVLKPKRILDFGCGIGKVSGKLAEKYSDLDFLGYDVSEGSINLARHQFHRCSNVKWTTELNDANGVDLILGVNVFHHIHPDLRDDVLKSLGAILNPGGRLLIIEHNPLNPLTRHAVATCEFDADAVLLGPSEWYRRTKPLGLSRDFLRYIVFFPALLKKLRILDPYLVSVPMGAQYVLSLKK